MERTEGNEEDHPGANVDFATTVPVLEDSTSGVDVVGGDDQVLHEVVVPKSESDGRVHETGGVTSKATLMWDVGGHLAERNHDEVANKPDETVPKEDTEGATSGGWGLEWAWSRSAG